MYADLPCADNVGSTSDCIESATDAFSCPTSAQNSFTRDVKIKVSPTTGSDGVYFDYLFALEPSDTDINDGLNTAGRYFVYDPDVTSGKVVNLNDKSSGAAVVASVSATMVALATAM